MAEQLTLEEMQKQLAEVNPQPKQETIQMNGGDVDVSDLTENSQVENSQDDKPQNDQREYSKFRGKLHDWKQYFGSQLEGVVDLSDLDNKSVEELQNLNDYCKFIVGRGKSIDNSKQMFLSGMNMMEKAGPYVGLKLDNLALVCSKEQNIMDAVVETSIVYGADIYVDPAIRLAIGIANAVMAVDAANRKRQIQPPNTEVDMNKKLSEKKNSKDITKQNGSNEQENHPASA